MSVWVLPVLIGLFAAIAGINGGGNLVGTFLPTRAVSPRFLIPILIASIALGPLIFGTAVSHTIAVEIINFHRAGLSVLAAAVIAAILTLLITWWLRLPSSTTIALTGGMIGATLLNGQAALIHWGGVAKVVVGLAGSVLVGYLVAFLATRLLWRILRNVSVANPRQLGYLQMGTLTVQGLAYGANDQEKAIGLMAVAFTTTAGDHYHVTLTAIGLPLVFWTAGLLVGGLRIARTVGGHIFRIRPLHSLAVQGSAAVTVVSAALLGLPVSTTETTDGSLFGLGSALAPQRVEWRTVYRLLIVWGTTLPLAFALGLASVNLLHLFHVG